MNVLFPLAARTSAGVSDDSFPVVPPNRPLATALSKLQASRTKAWVDTVNEAAKDERLEELESTCGTLPHLLKVDELDYESEDNEDIRDHVKANRPALKEEEEPWYWYYNDDYTPRGE